MMDESVAHELDRVEASASQQASQSQARAPMMSQPVVAAAAPTTPARRAPPRRETEDFSIMDSAPAARRNAPATSSSLNVASNLIDLDKSDDLVDPLADAELDWDAIDEVERSFSQSQSQSQNNSTRSNAAGGAVPGATVSATAPGASSRSIISIRSDTSEHARATTQSQARSKARSQGPLLVSKDESSEDERRAAFVASQRLGRGAATRSQV